MFKKAISCIATVAMIASLCVVNVSAAIANAIVTVNEPVELPDATVQALANNLGKEVPDGYKGYTLTFNVSGLGELTSADGLIGGYDGRRISNFTMAMSVDSASDVAFVVNGGGKVTAAAGMDGNNINAIFNASADTAYPTGNTTISDGTVAGIMKLIMVVNPGTVVKLSAYGQVNTYSFGSASNDEIFQGSNVSCTPSITLGEASTNVAVESVTLDKSSVELDLNGTTTATLTATVTPSDATDKTVTWTTSDANVATVENGVVTAKKVGTATITAKAGEKSATCEVTVTDSTPVAPVIPAKGTVIVDAVDGKVVIYADSKDASAIDANATFEIEYKGDNEALRREDGTFKKAIKRTFGEILGGEIGEGKVAGKVHFGIKIPETVSEADRAFFTINVK